jgi:Antibiotic biosynthesis monooxygenase
MRIATDARVVSVLSRTRTDPPAQAEAAATWIAASRTWSNIAGFVAGALLRSLDGERVVAYVQWALPGAGPDLASAGGFPPPDSLAASTDSHHYTVVTLEAPPGVPTSPVVIARDDGLSTLINIFDTSPARQQQLVETWITAGEPFTHHPGFVAAALHRSTDGTRVVNYAHWRSAADWRDLAARHGQDFAQFRPVGQSDPHLYEVVHLTEAA